MFAALAAARLRSAEPRALSRASIETRASWPLAHGPNVATLIPATQMHQDPNPIRFPLRRPARLTFHPYSGRRCTGNRCARYFFPTTGIACAAALLRHVPGLSCGGERAPPVCHIGLLMQLRNAGRATGGWKQRDCQERRVFQEAENAAASAQAGARENQ